MDEDRAKGAATDLGSKVKAAAGGLLGDSKTQAEGKTDQAKGRPSSMRSRTATKKSCSQVGRSRPDAPPSLQNPG